MKYRKETAGNADYSKRGFCAAQADKGIMRRGAMLWAQKHGIPMRNLPKTKRSKEGRKGLPLRKRPEAKCRQGLRRQELEAGRLSRGNIMRSGTRSFVSRRAWSWTWRKVSMEAGNFASDVFTINRELVRTRIGESGLRLPQKAIEQQKRNRTTLRRCQLTYGLALLDCSIRPVCSHDRQTFLVI